MRHKKLRYPLQQVLDIKIRRVQEAEKVVEEKKKLLEKEQQKLREAEKACQEVSDHHDNKLQQLRDALDAGEAPRKVEVMKQYLKEVKQKLIDEKKKVERQKKQVETAEKNLEAAQKILKEKRLEVDKLQMHKADWTAKEIKELHRLENKQLDEIGSLVYLSNKRKEQDGK